MNLFARFFGTSRRPPSTRSRKSEPPTAHSKSKQQLAYLAVRDVMTRHAIPLAWIVPQAVSATLGERRAGTHLRLVLKHWDPNVLALTFALQKAIARRLIALDPLSASWLMGISWEIAPSDDSQCPMLVTPEPPLRQSAAKAAAASDKPQRSTRKELDDKLAARDELFDDRPDFMPTQPMLS
jgi:hypothetical protein